MKLQNNKNRAGMGLNKGNQNLPLASITLKTDNTPQCI